VLLKSDLDVQQTRLRKIQGLFFYQKLQRRWSKGKSEMKSKQQSPCSNLQHWPVTSQTDACTPQAYACMSCMHCPWNHRPMHAVTAWALLFWFCLGYTFISSYYFAKTSNQGKSRRQAGEFLWQRLEQFGAAIEFTLVKFFIVLIFLRIWIIGVYFILWKGLCGLILLGHS
jgi:hypothetical protein